MTDVPDDLFQALTGLTLVELRHEGQDHVTLVFDDEDGLEAGPHVQVGEATIVDADAIRHVLHPADAATLGPLLRLVQAQVAAADATDGTLTIGFVDGRSLRCEPDARDRAWLVIGLSPYSGNIFMPGGNVEIVHDRDLSPDEVGDIQDGDEASDNPAVDFDLPSAFDEQGRLRLGC